MQSSIMKIIAECHDKGMRQEETVAYVLIRCCPCELPAYRPKEQLQRFAEKYYNEHRRDNEIQ